MNCCDGVGRKVESVVKGHYSGVIPLGDCSVENLCCYILIQVKPGWDVWNVVGQSNCSNRLGNGECDVWIGGWNRCSICPGEVDDLVLEISHSSSAAHGLVVDLNVRHYLVI